MSDNETVPQLLEATLTTLNAAQARADLTDTPSDQRAAADDIERAVIEVTSVFEARMQHHFRRGPFFKEVQKRLTAADQHDLAKRVIQYSHAVNVLKHGHGKSHRELLNMKGLPFRVRPRDREDTDIGLVDVLSPGFSEGFIDTLTQTQAFLDA